MATDPAASAPPDLVWLYTDGACSGNPGPGGWGAILRWRGHEKEISGGDAEKAVEYRRRAEELRQLAATFKNPASRNEILTLAAEWEVMADRAERRAKRKPT